MSYLLLNLCRFPKHFTMTSSQKRRAIFGLLVMVKPYQGLHEMHKYQSPAMIGSSKQSYVVFFMDAMKKMTCLPLLEKDNIILRD